VWDRLSTKCILGTVQFSLPRSATRNGRMVELNLRVERVTLPATRNAPAVEVTAILAREDNPPSGETRIEWRLLTDEIVSSLEEAVLRIDWYRLRWMIEIFFRTLKSGCKVEELQLNTKDRLEKALVIYMILAWRVLLLMTLGRQLPDLSCEIVFSSGEWQAAWIVKKKTPLPSTPPTLGEMVLIIASFGGFLGRKGDSAPGAEVLWRGLQRVRDFSEGISAVTQSYEFKLE
jgi:Transposase Tn5 dimerisation domain